MIPDVLITPKVMDRLKEGVKGWVPCVDMEWRENKLTPVPKLRPWFRDPIVRFRETGELGWNPALEPGKSFAAPPEVNAAIESRMAPEVRTTPREKFEALKRILLQTARGFTHDGVTTWPASVQKELNEAAWKMGKPGDLSLDEQVELLARTYIVASANKQKEHDQKHANSTHPSRGHYAA